MFPAATQNMALGKAVYQISTAGRSSAEKAVDGNADGNFRSEPCTYTIDWAKPLVGCRSGEVDSRYPREDHQQGGLLS